MYESACHAFIQAQAACDGDGNTGVAALAVQSPVLAMLAQFPQPAATFRQQPALTLMGRSEQLQYQQQHQPHRVDLQHQQQYQHHQLQQPTQRSWADDPAMAGVVNVGQIPSSLNPYGSREPLPQLLTNEEHVDHGGNVTSSGFAWSAPQYWPSSLQTISSPRAASIEGVPVSSPRNKTVTPPMASSLQPSVPAAAPVASSPTRASEPLVPAVAEPTPPDSDRQTPTEKAVRHLPLMGSSILRNLLWQMRDALVPSNGLICLEI